MKRRQMLKRTAALVTTGAIAGCLSDSPSAGGGAEETSDTDSDTETGTDEPTESTPALDDQSIETKSSDCGSGDEAEVSFGDSAVDVAGKIPASDPCHQATLADVTFDAEADALVVTVGVEDDGSEGCAQCLATVEYAANLGFTNGLPANVEVKHTSQGETKTVAKRSR
ncbi:hypothetical protein [Haloarchaeobius sp. DFWS5]|uniref:hypothetical protein n=1 Tax=Haloarchaeobius sp. DFWS5 TaxID=3446114 RepID=UPI003EBD5423